MTGGARAAALALCLSFAAIEAVPPLAAQGSRATTYATVLNEEDRPVRGLQSADLVLRDGGVRQGIVDAEPAREPLAVAVVVYGFDAAELTSLRPAIGEAARKLRTSNPATQVGLISAAPNVVMIGADEAASSETLVTLATTPSAPTMIDAILRGVDALASAPPDRRTVIAVVKARDAATAERPERVSSAVDANHIALWTVELASATAPAWPKAVSTALDDAARVGGSMRQTSTTIDGAKARLGVVVDCLLAQYLVTYNWPDPMLSTFSLVTRHDVGRVLTPSWSK